MPDCHPLPTRLRPRFPSAHDAGLRWAASVLLAWLLAAALPVAADTTPSEAPLRQAPDQIGIPTPATLSNRMGNQLGHSATPQRPPRSPDAR
ncbi:hypothetical protein [Kerstersia gyiorum]|jgi:hypothetical protein|uniref:hypothetical protein n=1 Tax=Kerstersia gyiorum TaxID=206506 RepID=UPI002432045E|nr:hypothetical protein [Kerstersia gyiorum]MCH4271012.1 hypothetical protein [Kerstersia gyiorum]MCI1230003.1 hypothetical protein [Kerstersia gyiorum]